MEVCGADQNPTGADKTIKAAGQTKNLVKHPLGVSANNNENSKEFARIMSKDN